MLFTIYGNCQADVLSNLLQQSPEFADRYKWARLRPCFAVSDQEVLDWAAQQAPEVHLLITQSLRKGWRAGIEIFDTDWLHRQCAQGAHWFEWSDMYYKAYEPHMAYPLTFPRRPPADYLNLLHVLVYSHGRNWRELIPFYTDAAVLPVGMLAEMHRAAHAELAKREIGCSLQVAAFIAENWQRERLFLTFNHPGRQVVRHAANMVLASIGIMAPVPEQGYFGFNANSGLPLLAAVNAMLDRPEVRDPAQSFWLDNKVVSMVDYFERWQASFDALGQDALQRELQAQMQEAVMARPLLVAAARHLRIDLS